MICYVDTETGGLHPHEAALIEVAAILLDDNLTELSRWESGVMRPRPGRYLTEEALKVNGYTRERIQAGRDPIGELHGFLAWLPAERCLLGGHNVAFDYGFLEDWFGYGGNLFRLPQVFSHRRVDSEAIAWWELVRTGETESSSLEASTAAVGIANARPHSAMSDAEAGVELLRRLAARRLSDRRTVLA